MKKQRKIFIEGIAVEDAQKDKKVSAFFNEFDDKIFRIAEKKFAAMCKKHGQKAEMTILLHFEDPKK